MFGIEFWRAFLEAMSNTPPAGSEWIGVAGASSLGLFAVACFAYIVCVGDMRPRETAVGMGWLLVMAVTLFFVPWLAAIALTGLVLSAIVAVCILPTASRIACVWYDLDNWGDMAYVKRKLADRSSEPSERAISLATKE